MEENELNRRIREHIIWRAEKERELVDYFNVDLKLAPLRGDDSNDKNTENQCHCKTKCDKCNCVGSGEEESKKIHEEY